MRLRSLLVALAIGCQPAAAAYLDIPPLSGDVTTSAGSSVSAIAPGAVTSSKMATGAAAGNPFTAPGATSSSTMSSRAGHTLNVVDDFGAACDGSTNDSTAFQNASNSHKSFFVPPGLNCVVGNLVFNSNSGQEFNGNGSTLTAPAGSNYIMLVEGFMPHVHGVYTVDNGALVSQTTVSGALSTSVSQATVVGIGSGGSAGTCTLTGTTGTGTPVVGTIVASGATLTAGAAVTITTAGAYSANPTNYQNEPVTATGCGSLTGVTLAFNMTGPTTLTVASATQGPGIQAGQWYQMQESNGAYKRGFVSAVSGTTLTLSDPPDVPVASGAPFWATFGAIQVANASYPTIDDIRCNANWGCVYIDDESYASDAYKGVNSGIFSRISTTGGHMFGVVVGHGAGTNLVSNSQFFGGFAQLDSYTGNGATTAFSTSYFLNLKREMYHTQLNGVTQTPVATITAGGASYGASVTGTMMWSGSGCSTNPVLSATTNSSGVITSVSTATPGVCSTAPSSTATTWAAGGGLSAGSGAEFQIAQYVINTSGLGVTFSTPPASGAAIAINYYTYGGAGFIDATGTTGGGNTFSSSNALQWSDDLYYDNANNFTADNITADAAAFDVMVLDRTALSPGQFSNMLLYWGATQVKAKNNATNVNIASGFSAPQPSNYPASGLAGAAFSLDAGASINATLTQTGGPQTSLIAGFPIKWYGGSNSIPGIGLNCGPSVAFGGPISICGSTTSNQIQISPDASQISIPGAFSYLTNATTNGVLDVQAIGAGGVAQLKATAHAKMIVNSVTNLDCSTTACAFGLPAQVPTYTVATLPACGSTVAAGAIAYVTDASSPSYNAALAGGSSTKTLAMCNGSAWTAH